MAQHRNATVTKPRNYLAMYVHRFINPTMVILHKVNAYFVSVSFIRHASLAISFLLVVNYLQDESGLPTR